MGTTGYSRPAHTSNEWKATKHSDGKRAKRLQQDHKKFVKIKTGQTHRTHLLLLLE
jgi:hypothetical protein